MKNIVLLMVSFVLCLNGVSQNYFKITTEPGHLNEQFSTINKDTITDLQILGYINANDIYFIRDSLKNITNLDISQSPIAVLANFDGNILPKSSFEDCTKLKKIVLNDEIIQFDFDAFKNCHSLDELNFPSKLKKIEGATFYNCRNIDTLNIPNTVEYIGSAAFEGCIRLKSITDNSKCKHYFDNLFKDCISLEKIITSSYLYIAYENVFMNCVKLKSIEFSETLLGVGAQIFKGCVNLELVIFNAELKYGFEAATFQDCHNLKEVQIPLIKGLIGSRAFENCYNLKTIDLSSILIIDHFAFKNCLNLVNINLAEDLISIGNHAFENCKNIIDIVIPSSVIEIGHNPFSGIEDKINVSPINSNYTSINGVVYDKKIKSLVFCPNYNYENLAIPITVEEIKPYAFKGCTKLKEINISNIKYIGGYCFFGCNNINEIFIPKTVMKCLGAFINCSAKIIVDEENIYYSSHNGCLLRNNDRILSSCPTTMEGEFNIPVTVDEIDEECFSYCSKLTKINIPSWINSFDYYLNDCPAYFNVSHLNNNFLSVDSILYTSDKDFMLRCPTTKKGAVIIDEYTEYIQSYAMSNCRNLTNIVLPKNLHSIRQGAFSNVESIIQMTIPSSVKNIEAKILSGCKSLKNIYMESKYPPNNSMVFDYLFEVEKYSTVVLHVPFKSSSNYAKAEGWRNFINIIESNDVILYSNNKEVNDTIYLTGEEQTVFFNIETNSNWFLNHNSNWIKTISDSILINKSSFSLMLETNLTIGARSENINFISNSDTITYIITQNRIDNFVKVEYYDVTLNIDNKKEQDVKVESNTNWHVYSENDWFDYEPKNETEGNGNIHIKLTNTKNEVRSGYLLIISDQVDTLHVYQDNVSNINNKYSNIVRRYPNPTSGLFIIDGLDDEKITSIKITSLNGQVILEQTIISSIATIDITNRPNGLYLLYLNGDLSNPFKIIKK